MKHVLFKKSMEYVSKAIFKNFIYYFFAVIPTISLLCVLVYLFPYTGLERIVALPAIFIINSTIIFIVMAKSNSLKKPKRIITWMLAILLTMFLSIAMYPQEHNPHVFKQIGNSISTLKDYDRISEMELDLSSAYKKNSIHNQSVEDLYVVALYKFKNQIPLDGTYHLYQRESTYFFDTTIRSIDEISDKLIGHHKVIWWYLDAFNY
ncbi:hypothetical protein AMS62_20355 [Bacillus sp. FJAT-18019]|nr:hypothetical protein AMS62_20355 [Bacillus sp. FJAT-18019]